MIIIIYSKQFYENKNIELVAKQQRRKQDILLRKVLLLKVILYQPQATRPTTTFSRYFSITIIAANITNPFQILLKCFWVLFYFIWSNLSGHLLILFLREIILSQKKNICWNLKWSPNLCWFFNSAWNIMRV